MLTCGAALADGTTRQVDLTVADTAGNVTVTAVRFGGITAALSYEHKAEVVHAVRDGARYGATVPPGQCDNVAACGNRNWAQLVQYVTSQRSDGALSTSQICVALVTAAHKLRRSRSTFTPAASTARVPTRRSRRLGCFDDGNVDTGNRVHVSVVRGGDKINLVFSSIPITAQKQRRRPGTSSDR